MNNFKYVWIDNKAKYTVLAIHGYGSSHEFIKNIFDKKINFNLIALDLPGSIYNPTNNKLTLDLFVKYVNDFINQRTKTKKIILLGHSFGAAVSAFVGNNKKVNNIIYLCPLNPYIVKSKGHSVLRLIHSEKTKNKIKTKITKKAIISFLKRKDSLALNFIKENPWLDLVKDTIIKEEKMKEIENAFILNANKSIFILGKNDPVIELKHVKEFINTLNSASFILNNSGHNPAKDEPAKLLEILNKNIIFKKRIIFRRYLKIKKDEIIKLK